MAGNPQNGAKLLGYGIDRPLSAAGCRRQRRDIPNAPHILANPARADPARSGHWSIDILPCRARPRTVPAAFPAAARSEEHTSELQSLMRNSYAVFCLKKKTKQQN